MLLGVAFSHPSGLTEWPEIYCLFVISEFDSFQKNNFKAIEPFFMSPPA